MAGAAHGSHGGPQSLLPARLCPRGGAASSVGAPKLSERVRELPLQDSKESLVLKDFLGGKLETKMRQSARRSSH